MSSSRCLKFNSCLSNIREVELFLENVVQEHSVNDEVYGNMLISLTEAVTNAIVHGNQKDESKQVQLDMASASSNIKFTIRDEGTGFQHDNLPDPTEPENILKIGGRGVFLMKQLSDDVQFSNDGSSVVLQFQL